MLFAAFVLERETIPLGYLPHLVTLWVQNAGAMAVLGIILLWLYSVSQGKGWRFPMIESKSGQSFAFIAAVLSLIGYGVMLGIAFIISTRCEDLLRDLLRSCGEWLRTISASQEESTAQLGRCAGEAWASHLRA